RTRPGCGKPALASAFELGKRREPREAAGAGSPSHRSRVRDLARIAAGEAKLDRAPGQQLHPRRIIAGTETRTSRGIRDIEADAVALDAPILHVDPRLLRGAARRRIREPQRSRRAALEHLQGEALPGALRRVPGSGKR